MRESTEKDFFRGKRPWSRIKDQVLGEYFPPYLAKIGKLPHDVLLIDAFAGPGRFEDGSEGSPLIICKAAQDRLPGRYQALFVNKHREHHAALTKNLEGFILTGSAKTIHGDASQLLGEVHSRLGDRSVFCTWIPSGFAAVTFPPCGHSWLATPDSAPRL